MGATRPVLHCQQPAPVSIRAPVMGATGHAPDGFVTIDAVSIRAPVMGATPAARLAEPPEHVSIRAPVMGAT